MRIIAGDARGRPLRAPRGSQTRPTSDLLRGSIFSMLAAMEIQPKRVLDLYAGTGALGIEALSRGAEYADFVERNRSACDAIRENLSRAGFASRARVVCATVERALPRLLGPFELVFLDPPYADRAATRVLDLPAGRAVLSGDTIIVYEHSRHDAPLAALGGLSLMRTRSHGRSSVSFYRGPSRESEA